MIFAASLVLLILSGALLWRSRPQAQWSGENAARFAAAIIVFLFAILLPISYPSLTTAQLLLGQLSAYAAAPLLLSVQVSSALNYQFSRMIWGRILLGWCVVFELLRHNQLLLQWSWCILAMTMITIVFSLFRKRDIDSALSITTVTFVTITTLITT